VQKKGDRYLEVDPWRIVERGFHKEQGKVSESLFCLSNENIGFRGSFEETYSGESLQGAYFNGLYEEKVQDVSGYRGISNRLCFMVNCPHALKMRVRIDGQELDLAKVAFEDFQRELDFKTGLLTRTFVWKLGDGRATRFTFRRTVDMVSRAQVHQQVQVTPLNWSGSVALEFLVVDEPLHVNQKRTYWQTAASGGEGHARWLVSRTAQTNMPLFTGHAVFFEADTSAESVPTAKAWDLAYAVRVEEGKTASLHRTWLGDSSRNPQEDNAAIEARGLKLLRGLQGGFAAAARRTSDYWAEVWKSVASARNQTSFFSKPAKARLSPLGLAGGLSF
jgi:maltose phosphorylase